MGTVDARALKDLTARIATVLREMRAGTIGERSKVSQGKLSARTDTGDPSMPPIHKQTIHNIETGTVRDPGFVTVARLVEALGYSLQDFCRCLAGEQIAAAKPPSEGEVSRESAPISSSTTSIASPEDFKIVIDALGKYLMEAVDRAAANAGGRPDGVVTRKTGRRRSNRKLRPSNRSR